MVFGKRDFLLRTTQHGAEPLYLIVQVELPLACCLKFILNDLPTFFLQLKRLDGTCQRLDLFAPNTSFEQGVQTPVDDLRKASQLLPYDFRFFHESSDHPVFRTLHVEEVIAANDLARL